ncbi:unnamed protein product [Plutella xylostella]|uniref:(diamondback moth) hypothetical protein n=1 Tax=Plutella xylostella TaxID=51655 RepID=A0A8S4GC68_PLUXY|nr:unnamed protein product [Plutella xylostella]
MATVNLSTEQFEKLLTTLASKRDGSFNTCRANFNGCRDSGRVEAFISAIEVFKKTENISDDDALMAIPLVLSDEAAVWWEGVKEDVKKWEDFITRLRHAFAPKKPAYMIYQDIVGNKQEPGTLTETFVANKRFLFAQLPPPAHSESQQIDMIFGQLSLDIRKKLQRSSVQTFKELLVAARGIEQLAEETGQTTRAPALPAANRRNQNRCLYCRVHGHTAEECRKKMKAESRQTAVAMPVPTGAGTATSALPKITCYGCGAPGVVRSKCTTCSRPRPTASEDINFCSVSVKLDARPRPMVVVEIEEGITGTAFLDTCAKMSVASYSLYVELLKRGHVFQEEFVNVVLADGIPKMQKVEMIKLNVKLSGRTIPTTFIVLPGSKDNKTLLGIGFLQDAGIALDLPQYTYHFVDEPGKVYELYQENFLVFENDVSAVGAASPYSIMTSLTKMKIGSMPPTSEYRSMSGKGVPETAKIPYRSYKPMVPPQTMEGAHTTRTPPSEDAATGIKRNRTLFDGYQPQFADYMFHDAQTVLYSSENCLSPRSNSLFNESDWHVHIDSVDFQNPSMSLDAEQQGKLDALLKANKDIFVSNGQPKHEIEHCIDTKNHSPISVPPYRLSEMKRELVKKEIDQMLQDKVIEPCSSPWAAPVVLVPKKDGSMRVCVDYRRLNAITIPDTYPLPRIDDLLHEAKPTPFMSTLDLKAGYWQIKVRDEDREKTAFITPFGIYKFNRMPFGLRNAPATFQRLIDRFKISLDVKMLAYLDDLIVFSATFEAHLTDLQDVFNRMKDFNLTANERKCRFCCSSVKYLGHYITPHGLAVDPEKPRL